MFGVEPRADWSRVKNFLGWSFGRALSRVWEVFGSAPCGAGAHQPADGWTCFIECRDQADKRNVTPWLSVFSSLRFFAAIWDTDLAIVVQSVRSAKLSVAACEGSANTTEDRAYKKLNNMTELQDFGKGLDRTTGHRVDVLEASPMQSWH